MGLPELRNIATAGREIADSTLSRAGSGGRDTDADPANPALHDGEFFSASAAMRATNAIIASLWPHMAAVFCGSVALATLLAGVPPAATLGLVSVSALLAIFVSRLPGSRAVTEIRPWRRAAAGLLAVPLPMFLFGLGMGRWTYGAEAAPEGPFAAFVLASAIATLILSGRRFALLNIQFAGWAGMVVWIHTPGALAALLALLPVAVLVDQGHKAAQRFSFVRQEAEMRLMRRAEDILRDFEESGQGWFWEMDGAGILTYISPAVAHSLHLTRGELIGKPIGTLLDRGGDSRDGERTLAFHLSARSAFQELPVRAPFKGEDRWWSITGKPVYDSLGTYVGFRGSGHDLTERRRSQEEASRLARFDSLTGLANRFQMSQTLERILNAPQEARRACAVFLLDLDRFKHVNDTLGHPAGDALLKQVSQRLIRVVGEHGRVGRLGGDEFQVILPDRQVRDTLAHLAHRIIESLSQPYSIEGQPVMIGASIGIALAPDDGTTSDTLVRNADLALYAAKDDGRGCYHFYATDLHRRAEEKRQLEQDLREAIHAGTLELHYQPVIEAATEDIAGFEALMRWNHPAKGMLSPTKFVEVAEDTGLIVAMGEWAIRTACQDLARWPESVKVAVNVSPLQFANPQLPAIITNAIAQAGITPQRLELEITESVFLSDDGNTDTMFAALKAIGVRLALDDFGTGYSSLSYLKKAPFDKIKIDQGFVRGATRRDSRNAAIIASITSLAQSLGMDTTAEGVETLDELELVRMLGCSHVQGFVYDPPLTVAEASRRLESGLRAVPNGPRTSRMPRQARLSKVLLDHEGQTYTGTIRNISANGAMVEGLWNVPPGTVFAVAISDDAIVTGKARWCEENRMGIEFEAPVILKADGSIAARGILAPKSADPARLRRAS